MFPEILLLDHGAWLQVSLNCEQVVCLIHQALKVSCKREKHSLAIDTLKVLEVFQVTFIVCEIGANP